MDTGFHAAIWFRTSSNRAPRYSREETADFDSSHTCLHTPIRTFRADSVTSRYFSLASPRGASKMSKSVSADSATVNDSPKKPSCSSCRATSATSVRNSTMSCLRPESVLGESCRIFKIPSWAICATSCRSREECSMEADPARRPVLTVASWYLARRTASSTTSCEGWVGSHVENILACSSSDLRSSRFSSRDLASPVTMSRSMVRLID